MSVCVCVCVCAGIVHIVCVFECACVCVCVGGDVGVIVISFIYCVKSKVHDNSISVFL